MALKIEEYDTIKELREKIRYTKDGRYQLRLNTIVILPQENQTTFSKV
jgi:hypothetical protein